MNADAYVKRAVRTKQVVQEAFKTAALRGGWKHREHVFLGSPADVFTRDDWVLSVHWSAGGRIQSASLLQLKRDPDTGEYVPAPTEVSGGIATTLRFGLVAGERDKKEHLIELLRAVNIDAVIETLNRRRRI